MINDLCFFTYCYIRIDWYITICQIRIIHRLTVKGCIKKHLFKAFKITGCHTQTITFTD